MPFNFVGENVREFFFRAVALTFEAAILREIEPSGAAQTKQIGNDLISRCILTNTVELVQSDTWVFGHPTKMYGPKIFLLTKIKPEYTDILYNQTLFPDPDIDHINH